MCSTGFLAVAWFGGEAKPPTQLSTKNAPAFSCRPAGKGSALWGEVVPDSYSLQQELLNKCEQFFLPSPSIIFFFSPIRTLAMKKHFFQGAGKKTRQKALHGI